MLCGIGEPILLKTSQHFVADLCWCSARQSFSYLLPLFNSLFRFSTSVFSASNSSFRLVDAYISMMPPIPMRGESNKNPPTVIIRPTHQILLSVLNICLFFHSFSPVPNNIETFFFRRWFIIIYHVTKNLFWNSLTWP